MCLALVTRDVSLVSIVPLKEVQFDKFASFQLIALFTVTFPHLHYNVFERGCEAISGNFVVSARNCLTSTLKSIVMQMRKGNCEKGYYRGDSLIVGLVVYICHSTSMCLASCGICATCNDLDVLTATLLTVKSYFNNIQRNLK